MEFHSIKRDRPIRVQEEEVQWEDMASEDIAIIGIGMKLPLADTIEQFRSNLREGKDCVRTLPSSRKKDTDAYFRAVGIDPAEIQYGEAAYLDGIDAFDYSFFKLSPKEASLMDPNQRLFLQTAWTAIEDSGYGGSRLTGSRTGVYLGYGSDSDYKRMIGEIEPDSTPLSMPGNLRPIIASRLSYLLDLKGPSLVVDTTCSSSLVAVHLACQAIRAGECDAAIAGGIQLHLIPVREFEVGVESSTARTRTFDDGSDGTGSGEGSIALVLKPLQKAIEARDSIYAVIKSSAINQDGSSVGITAPNADAQADVISEAWNKAGVDPETISYLEAHGTGTKLGDPIEMEGIKKAFRKYTDKKQFCAIGALKSNIGHLDNAAGIAGLLKAVISLVNKELYPTLHVGRPNRHIRFEESPVYLNTRLSDWEGVEGKRRCGVSSFGISGTNSHIVLEEAPALTDSIAHKGGGTSLFVLSARTESALRRSVGDYAKHLRRHDALDPGDLCYTASTGRGHYGCRLAVLFGNIRELEEILGSIEREGFKEPSVDGRYFVKLSGQGNEGLDSLKELSQTSNAMLRKLAESDTRYENVLHDICLAYINGADMAWEVLYRKQRRRRIHLPTYPFEENRCWLHYPDYPADAGNPTHESLYHRLIWERQQLSGTKKLEDGGSCLILKDAAGIGDRLCEEMKREGIDYIEVEQGEVYRKKSEHSYTTRGTYEDMERLCLDMAKAHITRIIHLSAGWEDNRIQTMERIERGLNAGVYLLYRFIKATKRMGWKHSQELMMISDFAESVIPSQPVVKPEHSALNALGKAIRWEYPHIHVRCMDIEGDADIKHILAELKENTSEYKVAYRDGKRYVERLENLNMADKPVHPISIKPEGVYVITGGLGGIGLKIAGMLASKSPIHLALINRTPFPPREQWEELLHSDGEGIIGSRIRAILEMERTGTKVECLSADVSDPDQLNAVWSGLKLRYGSVHGVVHAAGIGEGNLLAALSEEEFKKIMVSKVQGTWLIDQLLKQEAHDFLVLFSSAITLVGGVGSGPYAAANAYMDAFAFERNRQGKRTLVLNWPAWDNTGLAAGSETDYTKELFKPLAPSDGVKAFEMALNRIMPQVFVGGWNDGSHLFELGELLPFKRKETGRSDGTSSSAHRSETMVVLAKKQSPIKLKGKEGFAYSDVEQAIAYAWVQVLGYEELDIHDNFFEIGGDSILIARVHALIDAQYPGQATLTDLFSHPSIASLSEKISGRVAGEEARKPTGGLQTSESPGNADIAIIGLSLRMPEADNLDQYWNNLREGRESIREYPELRKRDVEGFIRHFTNVTEPEIPFSYGGFLDDVDRFDYGFFNLSPKEASLMDPNQRLFLEVCWEAIEDAGYGGGKLSGSQTGVYLGYADWPVYGQYITKKSPNLIQTAGIGNTPSIMASRISYLLDLQGPAFLVDTACSSSLVAVHMACMAIKNGECEQAIAGGVKVCLMPVDGVFEIGIESSHRRTSAFDDSSDGTVWGEGTVALLLKPLKRAMEDGDAVHAVIKGSAINQDGRSVGMTAPNALAQERVLSRAWEVAGINPETLTYIEAHGTGTKLGDPIEVDGIQRAFRRYTDRNQFCAIGSVKTNVGHLDSASGVAGLAKAIAALKWRELPATLHFTKPNRKIAFESSPVYVNDKTRTWETDGEPRRCGVSSFGFSGTNSHVVLEEAPALPNAITDTAEFELLALSGRSKAALQQSIRSYISYLAATEDRLADICLTANTGRGHYAFRLAVVAANKEEMLHVLFDLNEGGLETGPMNGCVYGEHSISTIQRENRPQGELTVAERRKLSEEANLIAESGSLEHPGKVSLLELGRLYAIGADIDWDRLYRDQDRRRVRVPFYPFQKTRCWIEREPERESTNSSLSIIQATTLPAVALTGRTAEGRYSPLETKLGQAWGQLLGLGEIDIYDDFFELGGNSILAIELEVNLEREGIHIDSNWLYEYRCIRQLAEYLSQKGEDSDFNGFGGGIGVGNGTVSRMIIADIEPFNDVFYRNCFYNSLFPVIRHFGGSILSILINDLILYDITDQRIQVGYRSVEPLENLFHRAGLHVDIRTINEDIVAELINCVSEGKPVILWVDAYYESIRTDTYLRRHLDHTLLIFGYDLDEQVFHLIEHDRMENLSYRKRVIPFDDIAKASQGFAEHFLNRGEHAVSHFIFESDEKSGKETKDEALINRFAANWLANGVWQEESMAALRKFVEDYQQMTVSQDMLNVHVKGLVDFVNDVMNAKQVDKYRLSMLLDGDDDVIGALTELMSDWDFIRKGLVRFMYSADHKVEAFELGFIRLRKILEAESQHNRRLNDLLEAHMDTIP